MNTVDRVRRRLRELLEVGTSRGKIKQKRLCEFVEGQGLAKRGKSEPWLSNILAERRGIPMKYLDPLAEFFNIPPGELVRHEDDNLIELTPSEHALIRRVRRMDEGDRWALYRMADIDHVLPDPAPRPKRAPPRDG